MKNKKDCLLVKPNAEAVSKANEALKARARNSI